MPMPPLPKTPEIVYLSAKIDPLLNSSVGFWIVFVSETGISSDGLSGAAQLPQNRVSSGFSN
jgi:hypothetical protein